MSIIETIYNKRGFYHFETILKTKIIELHMGYSF